ncbi:iron-sulfur cluster assembly scaffold protein NifU [Subtercola lobariae]|uniref:Iron-sulfur cluster assembly scaffold protein NifU n=2 Tax=Subtercola lobariae TaxID=1588641 RepID=A0A917B8P0_9MICO|nr:iron-sulfur cluster assembly scaffold protein NifU [Subtercola lobariae]
MQGLYQQVILDHAKERHGFGLAATADAHSHQVNPTCGDEITLQVQLDGGGDGRDGDGIGGSGSGGGDGIGSGSGSGTIRSIGWEGQGCAISQASASLLSDLAPGLTPAELSERIDVFRTAMRSKGTVEPDEELLGDAVVLGGASRYVARVKCAMLAWVAAEEALLQLDAR